MTRTEPHQRCGVGECSLCSIVTHRHTVVQLLRNTPDEKARELSAELRGLLANPPPDNRK